MKCVRFLLLVAILCGGSACQRQPYSTVEEMESKGAPAHEAASPPAVESPAAH